MWDEQHSVMEPSSLVDSNIVNLPCVRVENEIADTTENTIQASRPIPDDFPRASEMNITGRKLCFNCRRSPWLHSVQVDRVDEMPGILSLLLAIDRTPCFDVRTGGPAFRDR